MTYFRTTWNESLRFTGVALGLLVVLFLVFDSVEHARIVAAYHAESFYLARLAGVRLFTAIYLLLPLAGLFGPLTQLFLQMRRGELQALAAFGQSPVRRVLPFVMLGGLLGVSHMVFGATVAPWAAGRYRQMIDEEIKHKPEWGEKWRPSSVWYRGPSGIWRMERKDETDRTFQNVLHFRKDKDGSLQFVLEAERLAWNEGKWIWSNGRRISLDESVTFETLEEQLPETPRYFRYGWENGEELDPWKLTEQIEWNRKQGHSVAQLEGRQVIQWALPYLTCWFPLLAFVLVGAGERRQTGWIFGLAFGGALLAFVLLQAASRLAALGAIGVLPATALPVAVVAGGILSAYMLREFRKTYCFNR